MSELDAGAPESEATKAHLTVEEAAAFMSLPLETFRLLASDPDLQPVRIMGVYHYRVADVERFMEKMELDD